MSKHSIIYFTLQVAQCRINRIKHKTVLESLREAAGFL